MGSTEIARAVVDGLITGGVEHVVVAPGSRSAPLALALFEAAQAGELTLHTRIDERSAAFLALGIAKTSGRHVAVLTTSGTATANLHPAVLEAHHSEIPLIALTADRPESLRGTNANQTTDQRHLYGRATLVAVDVPADDLVAAEEAVQVAIANPGPSQLNLQFAEPLVPGLEHRQVTRRSAGAGPAERGRSVGASESVRVRSVEQALGAPSVETSELGAEALPEADLAVRGVVVAGDDAGQQARWFAEHHGWPLLAEPTSGARSGSHAIQSYTLLLGDESLTSQIERVVVFGHPTLSRAVTSLISRTDVEVWGVPGPLGLTDPGHVAQPLETGELTSGGEPTVTPWLEEWRSRDRDATAKVDGFLDASVELLPHQVVREVSRAVPPDGLLFVGASSPIRHLDLVAAPYDVGGRRRIIANRGLAGIDGTISSAIGAVIGRPRTSRAFALLGDVTFLHDTNGLLIGPGEQVPDLQIVVVNDDGGSIFASLEQGDPAYADSFEKLFGTPHGTDLAAICQAHRVPHWKVTSIGELTTALANPMGGIEVIEAVVGRADRRDLDAAIRGLVG